MLSAFLAALALVNCSDRPSPRERKTKSPGTLGCGSPSLLESPRFSPRFKRKKTVRISETVSFHDSESDFDESKTAELQQDEILIDKSVKVRAGGSLLGVRINTPIPQAFEAATGPSTPVSSISASITKTSLEDDTVSPQSVIFNFETIQPPVEPPRPILKRLLTRKIASTFNLFKTGSIEDLQTFYAQGTQLPMSPKYTEDLFSYLFQAVEVGHEAEKLKIIYEHDRQMLLDYILLKGSEIPLESLMNFVTNTLTAVSDEIISELDLFQLNHLGLRVAIYLHAIKFKIDQVYKIVNELIDDEHNAEFREIARILLERYYNEPGSLPLSIYAARNDAEETLLNILAFDPEELNRLDSDECSVVYHAALEGNLGILEALKEQVGGKRLLGRSPLIATAIRNRDDSLEFFLVKNPTLFTFTDEEIEEAAFTSAMYGKFTILRILKATGRLNLYCHHGSSTLLSVALKNDQLGFAQLLVERMGYNVNFVGEDPVNPAGNALAYLLTKYGTLEIFLKRGANRNVMVPASGSFNEDDEAQQLIPLKQYLETCNDPKLIKLFNKYP